MTPLFRYCEGVMEAVWLSSLVSIPLFLNFHGDRMESQKNHLLRSLSLVLLAAWLARIICKSQSSRPPLQALNDQIRSFFQTPLMIPTASLALTIAISTLLSISPDLSFYGAPGRSLGSYSYFCCLLFFATLALHVRSALQLDRIVTVAILTSIPIALYGIGQRFSIEPISWLEGPDASRVRSTLGQTIYLGAYVMMLQSLTLSRVFLHADALRSSPLKGGHKQRCFFYGTVAALQILALIFTVSRGPFLGWLAGSGAFLILLAIYKRKRVLVATVLTAAVAIALALVALSFRPRSPASPPGRFEIQRLSEILNPKIGTGAERAAAWSVAAQAASFRGFMGDSTSTSNRVSIKRLIFGYGPETVSPVSRLYSQRDFNAVLQNHELFDRFHNEFWDTLITTGILGLLAYLTLTFAIVFYGLKWLGVISTSRTRNVFWAFLIGGSVLGIVFLTTLLGQAFIGVGLRLGCYVGLLVFLVRVSWCNEDLPIHRTAAPLTFLKIGLIASLISHPIETTFSFTFETSLLLFWSFSALLLLAGHILPRNGMASSQTATTAALSLNSQKSLPFFRSIRHFCHSRRTEIIAALLSALVLANLGVILIQKNPGASTAQTLFSAETYISGHIHPSLVLPFGLALIWITLSVMLFVEFRGLEPAPANGVLVALSLSGLLTALYWGIFAAHTAGIISFLNVTLDNVDRFVSERTFILDFHYWFTLFLILLLGFVLSEPCAVKDAVRNLRPRTWVVRGAAAALAIGALLIIHQINLKRSKAGIITKLAQERFFQAPEQRNILAALHEHAISLAPSSEVNYLGLAETLIHQAVATSDPPERLIVFSRAEHILNTGSRFHPIDPAFPDRLGLLYTKWAETEPQPERKSALAHQAIRAYQATSALDPGNFAVWRNIGQVQLFLLNSLENARLSLLRCLDLNPRHHPAFGLLGNLYFQMAVSADNSIAKNAGFQSAATHFEQAILLAENTAATNAIYRYALNLGSSRVNLGNLPAATRAYKTMLQFSPPTERWRGEETLARLFADLKDSTNAIAHAQRAIDLAPAANRLDLLNLKNKISESLRGSR